MRMPPYTFSTFSVARNRFQQNEDGSTITAENSRTHQIYSSSASQHSDQGLHFQLATMTTSIRVLVKLFRLSASQTVTSSPPSTHQTFALSCTVLLLLVPFCQAMVLQPTIVPLSKHLRSGNERVMSSKSIRSQNERNTDKIQHSTSRPRVIPLEHTPKGELSTLRITDHHCFSLKNNTSCSSQGDCKWCKPWCIANGAFTRLTCDEIIQSIQLPEVKAIMPPKMWAGMPTLVMILGTHLSIISNKLISVEFELSDGLKRNCSIVEPVTEQEIRCILEGVEEKKGTLLRPKLRYNITLRDMAVPSDIDSNETLEIDSEPFGPDKEDNGSDKEKEGELHYFHYLAGLLFIVGLVAIAGALFTLRRRQALTVVKLVERRLLMGRMKRTLLKRGLYTEYSSVTLKMKLGDGNFGEVYRAEVVSVDGRQTMEVAIKKLRKGSSLAQVKEFLTEGIRMSGFEHERILRPVAITLDSSSPYMPSIVLPIMANGDLCRYLRKSKVFPIVRLLTFAVQIAEGMEYLASANFVHGDLAARNCLLDEKYQLKIGDFGLCRQLQYRSDYVTINDIYRPVRWMAVECLTTSGKSPGKNSAHHRNHQPKFSLASDVWSFGVLLWEIFTLGSYPYEEFDNWSLVKAVAGGYRLHRPLNCPTAVYALMNTCWDEVPARRPKIGQLREQLAGMLAEIVAEMRGGAPSELAHSSVRESGYTSLAERFVQSRRISNQSTTSTRSTLSMASSVTTTSSHLA